MGKNKKIQRLNIPGISPVIIDGERGIKCDAVGKRFITNKYIKCLHDICWVWGAEGYYVLDTLISHGIIKQQADYSMEWTLTKTSLAWLFKKMKISEDEDIIIHVPGHFWNPIATLFGEKKEILTKLAHNKNIAGENWKSPDIEKLLSILRDNGIQLNP